MIEIKYQSKHPKTFSFNFLFVLGSHRTGTSVLSRALVAVGVYLGNSLMVATKDNPKGYFEDQLAYQINNLFLEKLRCRWDTLILPRNISSSIVSTYKADINEKVLTRFNGNFLCGLKDPRISRLWRFWLPVVGDAGGKPIFLLSNRHPFSVAQSLAARDQMPEAHALALWAVHQLDSLEALVEHGGIVVDYDIMMKAPRQELYRIANFIGTTNNLDPNEIGNFENYFLSQSLRHSQFLNESAISPLQELCLVLHAGLMELAQLPGGLVDKHFDQARDLLIDCRAELSKSIGWMQAIDDLQILRYKVSSYGFTSEAAPECEARLYISEIVDGLPQSYTESRGAALLYPISKERQVICLPLPVDLKPLASIRLDPSNRPVALLLHSLTMLHADGAESWHWDGDVQLLRNIGGIDLRKTLEGLLLLCWNDDPKFDLALPPDILTGLRGSGRLVIDLTPLPLLEVCSDVLRRDERLISDFRHAAGVSTFDAPSSMVKVESSVPVLSKDLECVAALLKGNLARRDQTTAEQATQIRAMQDELLRAEAQLDLLKDLMLGGGKGEYL